MGTLAFVFREHLGRSFKMELQYGIENHYNASREPGTLPAVWDHIHTEVGAIKFCHTFPDRMKSRFFFNLYCVLFTFRFSSTVAVFAITRIGTGSKPGPRRIGCPILAASRERVTADDWMSRERTWSHGTRRAVLRLYKCG